MKKISNALFVVIAVCGAARLAYDEYWLRELMLQVRADTAFEARISKGCKASD